MNKQRLRDNIWGILFFALLLVLALIVFRLIGSTQGEAKKPDPVIGGVFVGSIWDSGLNQSHYEGLKSACAEMNLRFETEEYVDVKNNECERAVEKLVKKGATVIFLTSEDFSSTVHKLAKDHPDTYFFISSSTEEEENVTTYATRIYQIRYLAGIIAGMKTESNVLGFVSVTGGARVCREVNAYLLGARSVNPKAKVKVRFVKSWYEKTDEERMAKDLIEKDGADVLTYLSSIPVVVDLAEEKGVYSIGYSRVAKRRHSDRFLGTVTYHFDVVYHRLLQDYVRGSVTKDGGYWFDVQDKAIGLEELSDGIDPSILRKVNSAKKGFAEGQDVFIGEIRKQDGSLACRRDERISDEGLRYDMTWFVEGVETDAD